MNGVNEIIEMTNLQKKKKKERNINDYFVALI